MKRTLFLDRDGTLIRDPGYLRDPDAVEALPGAIDALRVLAPHWRFVVVSNQSGIGRGLISEAEAAGVHARFVEIFGHAGILFYRVMYCPHDPDDGCACRKPRSGMLVASGASRNHSAIVGDKRSDLDAGAEAGCEIGVLYTGSWPDVVETLQRFADRSPS